MKGENKMNFCSKCGTQVNDSVQFCPRCGAPIEAALPRQPVQQPDTQPVLQEIDPAKDAQQNKAMAVLAYIIFFIPLVTGDHRKSPFVKFHANQGTVLFLAMLAFGILYGILNALLISLLFSVGGWGIWSIITTILGLLWLVPAIFCILGIVHAVKGEKKPLPLIGRINLIK